MTIEHGILYSIKRNGYFIMPFTSQKETYCLTLEFSDDYVGGVAIFAALMKPIEMWRAEGYTVANIDEVFSKLNRPQKRKAIKILLEQKIGS